MSFTLEQSSFRDRDGFIFYHNGSCYRAVKETFASSWDQFLSTGLYRELTAEERLISIEEVFEKDILSAYPDVYKVYRVKKLPFISYPSEWSFAQLKKAALLTLSVQRKALEKGFSLKDASAYNVQFTGKDPLFIDSLSFEPYGEDRPWAAYKQFCRHFLGPLLLGHYGFSELQSLFIRYEDGIPLDLCSKLLPWRSRFWLLAYTHIHLHARMEKKHAADQELKSDHLNYSRKNLFALLDHLEMGIRELKLPEEKSNWTTYYETFNYKEEAFAAKQNFVKHICEKTKGKLCVDLGANSGVFSLIAANCFELVLACDNDPSVLKQIRKQKKANVLTLLLDLNRPTPAYGWQLKERSSFPERVKHNDLCLALALVHHICIANNVPLAKLAEFFSQMAENLLIEFVPKEDEQVRRLLVSRKDVFTDYTKENFLKAFSVYYTKAEEQALPGSGRVLYYFNRRTS